HPTRGAKTRKSAAEPNPPACSTERKKGGKAEARGRQMTGFVQAGHIETEKENEPPQPPQPPQNPEVSIDGMLKTIVGAVPTLTLMVNTTPVHTTSATTVHPTGTILTPPPLPAAHPPH